MVAGVQTVSGTLVDGAGVLADMGRGSRGVSLICLLVLRQVPIIPQITPCS